MVIQEIISSIRHSSIYPGTFRREKSARNTNVSALGSFETLGSKLSHGTS